MSKAVIKIEDSRDGKVDVEIKFTPPMKTNATMCTPSAMAAGIAVIAIINAGFLDFGQSR